MSAHAVLLPETHRNVTVRTGHDADLGSRVMAAITFPLEFRALQNHYPIVFQRNAERTAFQALALLGFENGENLFLKNGSWDADYIPLSIDVQPFLIGRAPSGAERKQVHIDMDSPRVGVGDARGVRLFSDDGRATAFVDGVADKLAQLDEGYAGCQAYLEWLEMHDLLEPFTLEIALNDGSKNSLVGFHTINEDRLATMDAKAVQDMHAKDYALPIYMALASLSRFAALVARKNAVAGDG